MKASPWNMHVWDEQACFKCLNCCSICPWISDYLMLIDTDRRNDKFWQIASSVDQHSLQFASDCANISIVFWHVTLLASSHFCGKNLWRSIVEQRVTSQNAMSVFELWSQLSRRISIPHSKIRLIYSQPNEKTIHIAWGNFIEDRWLYLISCLLLFSF